jgi:Peptidase of plants and bacteria
LGAIEVVGPGRTASHPAAPPAVGTVVAGDRTVRMINLGGPRSAALLDRVAADIGGAVGAVEAFWGTDWPPEITVVATGSARQFVTEAGGGPAGQWADIAAVAVADRADPGRRIAIGQRIVFAPGAADMSARALRIVLTHELFHYAARADTALDAPQWLTEGVADYVARPHTALGGVTPLPTALPSDADLAAPGPARSQGYDRAWWFARFVADTRRPAALRALYQAACGVGHVDLATALHAVLGTNMAGVLAEWQQWLARQPSH